MLTDAVWAVGRRDFPPGSSLVVFSDGVLEARDTHDDEFGLDRVLATLAGVRDRPAGAVVDRLRAQVRDHAVHQRDDVTVLVVRRHAVPAASGAPVR